MNEKMDYSTMNETPVYKIDDRGRWDYQPGDLVVQWRGMSFDGQMKVAVITKIWRSGVIVTDDGTQFNPPRGLFRDDLNPPTAHRRGSGRGYIRPFTKNETPASVVEQIKKQRDDQRDERQQKIDAKNRRVREWLIDNGPSIATAFSNPIKTEYGEIFVAELVDRWGQPVVVTFHSKPAAFMEKTITVWMAIATVDVRHSADGTDDKQLGSFGSSFATGESIALALANYFT